MKSQTNKHHMELLNRTNTITVPCFNLENVLSEIKTHHIDFYSLDVEGGEMTVLESLRNGLKTRRITVDVWSVEYRVWDGHNIIDDKSMEKLNALRRFFSDIGGYSEHSQISLPTEKNMIDGRALDVVFVRNEIFCKTHKKLPKGSPCPT